MFERVRVVSAFFCVLEMRHVEIENSASVVGIFEAELATMNFNQRFGNVQTKTRA